MARARARSRDRDSPDRNRALDCHHDAAVDESSAQHSFVRVHGRSGDLFLRRVDRGFGTPRRPGADAADDRRRDQCAARDLAGGGLVESVSVRIGHRGAPADLRIPRQSERHRQLPDAARGAGDGSRQGGEESALVDSHGGAAGRTDRLAVARRSAQLHRGTAGHHLHRVAPRRIHRHRLRGPRDADRVHRAAAAAGPRRIHRARNHRRRLGNRDVASQLPVHRRVEDVRRASAHGPRTGDVQIPFPRLPDETERGASGVDLPAGAELRRSTQRSSAGAGRGRRTGLAAADGGDRIARGRDDETLACPPLRPRDVRALRRRVVRGGVRHDRTQLVSAGDGRGDADRDVRRGADSQLERANLKAVRWIATLLILSAAVTAAAWYVIEPQQCNLTEGEVQRATERLARMPSDPTITVPLARQNIARITACLECADDVNRAMVLAANLRFAGRPDDAIAVYRDALRQDQRPELYLNLAQTQLDMGNETEGIQTLTKACLAAPNFVDYIPSRHMQMYLIVHDYYEQLMQRQKQQRGSK